MRFCQLRLNEVIARWPGLQRIRPLAEAGAAPGLTDLAARRPEHLGDRFAAEPRIGPLDLPRRRRREPGNTTSGRSRLRHAGAARVMQHQRRLKQIVVAAVGARADQRLVELNALARRPRPPETRCRD